MTVSPSSHIRASGQYLYTIYRPLDGLLPSQAALSIDISSRLGFRLHRILLRLRLQPQSLLFIRLRPRINLPDLMLSTWQNTLRQLLPFLTQRSTLATPSRLGLYVCFLPRTRLHTIASVEAQVAQFFDSLLIALRGSYPQLAALELGEALSFIRRKPLIRGRYRRTLFNGFPKWRDNGGDDVLDGRADCQAMQLDHVAGHERGIRVVDQVVRVVGEVLFTSSTHKISRI